MGLGQHLLLSGGTLWVGATPQGWTSTPYPHPETDSETGPLPAPRGKGFGGRNLIRNGRWILALKLHVTKTEKNSTVHS